MTSPISIPENIIGPSATPIVVVTDGYINDPIEFVPDNRFIPVSVVQTIQENNNIDRDFSDFLKINSLDTTRTYEYSYNLNSPVYGVVMFDATIDQSINSF